MQYIMVNGDIIEVNTYPIQLFHTVKCICLRVLVDVTTIKMCLIVSVVNYYPTHPILLPIAPRKVSKKVWLLSKVGYYMRAAIKPLQSTKQWHLYSSYLCFRCNR